MTKKTRSPNPEKVMKNFSEAAKSMENFVEKASEEIPKGTLKGKFYSVITILLLALFIALILGAITSISRITPPEYKVITTILTIIILAAFFYYIWFAVINPHLNKREKNLEKISKQINAEGYKLIQEFGRRPEGKDHFNDNGMDSHQKNAVNKMIELGLIWLAQKSYKNGYEYAYRWTQLGYELMTFLDIKKMSEEEFQNTPQHERYKKAVEDYKEFRKNMQE